jgi:hypothetical protein
MGTGYNPYKPAPNPSSPIGPKLKPKKPDSRTPVRAGPAAYIPPSLERGPNVQIRQHAEVHPPISSGQHNYVPKRARQVPIGDGKNEVVKIGDVGRFYDYANPRKPVEGTITELMYYPHDGSAYAIVQTTVKVLIRKPQ